MPKATTCLFINARTIEVEEALNLRNELGRDATLDFRCGECGMPVRPFNAGGTTSAHFEHFKRNPDCSRSDA